jgi:hypothetical protein
MLSLLFSARVKYPPSAARHRAWSAFFDVCAVNERVACLVPGESGFRWAALGSKAARQLSS